MGRLYILILLPVACVKYSEAKDWDYLVFCQSWPRTASMQLLQSNPSYTFTLPANKDAWSIHGLWPSFDGSRGPDYCNKTWVFNPDELETILLDLTENWKNIIDGHSIDSLWAHEWNKHGTCATDIEPLNSELKYFQTGLDWLEKYNMTKILANGGIAPSDDTRTLVDIYNAVKNEVKFEPNIQCIHVKGIQYLVEIRICFSRSLELIDCKPHVQNEGVDIISNCNSEGILYYTSSE